MEDGIVAADSWDFRSFILHCIQISIAIAEANLFIRQLSFLIINLSVRFEQIILAWSWALFLLFLVDNFLNKC